MTSTAAYPVPESMGGWASTDPADLGVSPDRLRLAIKTHDEHPSLTQAYGGALLIVYRGRLIGESYTTGQIGEPQPWTAETCNDIKSSTKSIFGTAVGRFLADYADSVTLDSRLVGSSAEESLIPQIWEQPLTDRRKTEIKVRHALSMTSGHSTPEPWLAPAPRRHTSGYSGPFQMAEYSFGWWQFEGIANQAELLFEPGHAFNYSNYGLELLALAMRNQSGEELGPYLYDRVLGPIGLPKAIRDNHYREMPYADDHEHNFSDSPGWGRGGSLGCNAYGADRSASSIGYNTVVGSTFRCSARDFARLGYLWLRKGRWGEVQLVPTEWFDLATKRVRLADGTTPINYGLTFWLADDWAGVPADTFLSRGHNLNHCAVIPSLDLVIVRQGNYTASREENEAFTHSLIRQVVAAIEEK